MRWSPFPIGLLAACGSADIADGTIRCSTEGECPPGFTCAADLYCYRQDPLLRPDGAQGIDGAEGGTDAPPDAPPDAPVDAPPLPCTDDGVCDARDTFCADWYCDLTVNECAARPANPGAECMARSCPGGWSPCGGDGTCNETGSQQRTCVAYACQGIYCTGTNEVETQGCPFETDGNTCGADFCDPYPTSCPDDLAGECDQDGTRSRTCYARRCAGGACGQVAIRTETEGCTRPTDGNDCNGGTTCGGYDGSCNDCRESRTCTDRTCQGGTCASNDRSETRNCGDGTVCAPSTCGPFDGSCDGDCQEASTCTDFTCSGGACGGTDRVQTQPCTGGELCGFNDCGGGCIVDRCCGSTGLCTVGACGLGSCNIQCDTCPFPPCPIP